MPIGQKSWQNLQRQWRPCRYTAPASATTPASVVAIARALPSTKTRGLTNQSAIPAASASANAAARPTTARRSLPVFCAISTSSPSRDACPMGQPKPQNTRPIAALSAKVIV